MTLLSVIAALLLEHYREFPGRKQVYALLFRHADYVKQKIDLGERLSGFVAWCAASLPGLALAVIASSLFYSASVFFAWLLALGVFYLFVEFRPTMRRLEVIRRALRHDHLAEAQTALSVWCSDVAAGSDANQIARLAIEHALRGVYHGVFALAFWFAVLPGPSGVILYASTYALAAHWGAVAGASYSGARFARTALEWVDWIPLRLTALSFAVVGNFEDALYCWRSQAGALGEGEAVVLASGAGALGVRLGGAIQEGGALLNRAELGTGEAADADYLQSCEGLLWRALVLWLVALFFLSALAWVGE
jgi:adenosylcobinamide-phosphate synthase